MSGCKISVAQLWRVYNWKREKGLSLKSITSLNLSKHQGEIQWQPSVTFGCSDISCLFLARTLTDNRSPYSRNNHEKSYLKHEITCRRSPICFHTVVHQEG